VESSMSAQPTSIILGTRAGAPPEESALAGFLQMASRVLDVLRRRWPLFAIPLLTTALVALSFGLTYPRRYWVATTFERRNNLVIAKLISNNSPYSFAALRQSLVADVKNFNVVGAAVAQLGLLKDLPRNAQGELAPEAKARRDAIVGQWVDSVSVLVRESGDFLDVVELRYLGEQPEQATALLAILRESYTASMRTKVTTLINDAHIFFDQEAKKCQEKVASLRDEIRRIDLEHPGTNAVAANPLEQRLAAANQNLEQLDRERQKAQASISACEQYLSELTSRPASESLPANRPASIDRLASANPRHARLAAEIASLARKIDDLKTARRMTDQHPEVARLHRQLDSLQADLEKEPEQIEDRQDPASGATPTADPWAADRRKVEAESRIHREALARIERDIKSGLEDKARLEEDMKALPERRQQYALLQQSLQSAQADLDLWNNNTGQLNRILTAEAENRGIQFIPLEEPHLAGRLRTPTANGFLSLCGGIGLALAIAIVFLRELLDRSFKDPARVRQALGIPVLETIGEIQVGRPAGWFVRRRLLPAAVTIEFLAVAGMGTLVYLALERPEVYDRLIARSTSLWGG
jgi:hypothetical protein